MPKKAPPRPKSRRAASTSLEDNVGVRVSRIAEVFTRLAKRGVEDCWGVRATELRVLNFLDGKSSVSITELARRIHVDKAWISRSVGQLVEKGLVERQPDPDDARASSVALTVEGQALLDDIRPHARHHEKRVLKGLNERAFKAELDRLLANAEAILDDKEP